VESLAFGVVVTQQLAVRRVSRGEAWEAYRGAADGRVDMGGFVRCGGYFGLVLFLGGVALAILLPRTRFSHNPLIDTATGAAAIGYVLMFLQAVRLAVIQQGGWARRLLGVTLVLCLGIGVIGFVGIALIMATTSAVAAG
jgi:hypothetical protein